MEDGDVAGVDMAGLPLGIFLQRVVERAVDGSAFLGGEGQQPCARRHILRNDEGLVGGEIACRRSTGKVGTDAAFGGASRPCAEPTPVTVRRSREGELALQREASAVAPMLSGRPSLLMFTTTLAVWW